MVFRMLLVFIIEMYVFGWDEFFIVKYLVVGFYMKRFIGWSEFWFELNFCGMDMSKVVILKCFIVMFFLMVRDI